MRLYFRNHLVLLSFLLCIFLGTCIVLPNMIFGDGIYRLVADFDYQSIPFNIYMNHAIKTSNVSYIWGNGLGSSFIGTFSYYGLFSPFALIGYLFPSSMFPYLIGFIFILKYGIAGVFSYLFLQRYVTNKKYAVLGALLYSFSGFQLTNILFYQFHDAVAFFPFLLYSLDCFFYDKRKKIFCYSIVICALTNWFFFIEEIVFVFIYFLIKVLLKDYQINKKVFFHLALEVILGIGMSCFILLPVFLFTISNPRLGTSWSIINSLKYPFTNYLELLRAFFFFPDTMANRSILLEGNYDSVELYLPIIGMIFVFSYLFHKPKDSISIIIYSCLLFMFIPILNSSFVLFNTHYYARWFFMPIMMFCLASIKAMDQDYSIKSGIFGSFIGIGIFLLGLVVYHFKWGLYIGSISYILFVALLTFMGMIFIAIIYRFNRKSFFILTIISIFISVFVVGNVMIYRYKGNRFILNDHYKRILKTNDILSSLKKSRSYSDNSCPSNLSLFKNIYDIHSFNSNISGGEFSFLWSLGIERDVSTQIDNKELLSFLGVESFITCDYGKEELFEIENNLDALTIGFVPLKYISEEEFSQLSVDERISLLKNTVVLTTKQIHKYHDLFNSSDNVISSSYQFLKNGFQFDSSFDSSRFLVFQIPYDSGWKATINGKNVSIEKVDNGLIGIQTMKGDNHIILSYTPPGFLIGIIISIISFIFYLVYCFYYKRN